MLLSDCNKYFLFVRLIALVIVTIGLTLPELQATETVTFKLGTIADVTVRESDPNRNFGNSNDLQVGKDPSGERQSYLLFYINGPGKILSAKLKLKAVSSNKTKTTVHAVEDVAWGEDELTWNSRPELGKALGTIGGTTSKGWCQLDVSSYVSRQGFIAIGLSAPDRFTVEDAGIWCSREQDRNVKAHLEVMFDNNPGPGSQQKLSELRIFDPDLNPKSLDFRGAEKRALEGMAFDSWEDMIEGVQGVIGKAMNENERGRDFMPNGQAYYQEYKKRNPEKLAMMHISSHARFRKPGDIMRIPLYTDDFFPGHWLYQQGQVTTKDLVAAETRLFVEDAMYFRKNDVVGIFVLTDGQIDWLEHEYALVKKVDEKTNSLIVTRGQYGSIARSFKAQQTYVAAIATSMSSDTWTYNLALSCPKDPEGKRCIDRVMEIYRDWLMPGSYLDGLNGIALDADVFYVEKKNHPQGWRHVDVNGDRVPDAGIINGINDYGLGKLEFHQRLREMLGPDMLISGDISASGQQRSVTTHNGGESESFPHGGDAEELRMWSNGVNKFRFWLSNAAEPSYCFSPIKEERYKKHDVMQNLRLQNAGIQLLGAISAVRPFKRDNALPDEIVKGVEQQPNWLGARIGEVIRPGLEGRDLLNGEGVAMNSSFLNAWSSDDATISRTDREMKIAGTTSGDISMVATYGDVKLSEGSIIVAFDLRAEPRPDYPEHLPRLVWVSVDHESHLVTLPMESAAFSYSLHGQADKPLEVLSLALDGPEIVDSSWETNCEVFFKRIKDEDEAHWGYVMTLPSFNAAELPKVSWQKTVTLPKGGCKLGFYYCVGENRWRTGLGTVRYDVFVDDQKVHSSDHDSPEWKQNAVDLSEWSGRTVTLRFEASAGKGYNGANAIWGPTWIVSNGQQPYSRPDNVAAHQLLTHANSKVFPASFWFRDMGKGTFNITLNIEGSEPVYISNFRVYNADDVMAGEYANGAIFANPSTRAYTFDLDSLFPGSRFRRLQGTANQDTAVNDGSAVGSRVTIPAQDGLFLTKE
ncbi:MAG: DNRLRE domain-containing protein [Puniceicoccaceae bacterium]